MGSLFHKPYSPFQQFFNGKKLRAIIVGLDCAGKTTIIYKMNLQDMIPILPLGSGFETVEFQKVKLTAWDLQSDERYAKLYEFYYTEAEAIGFVVDSTDRDRIGQAAEQLKKLREDARLKDAALLVLANKQDREAMNVEEVTIKLGLLSLANRKWRIEGSCAMMGDGLYEGFQWLCDAVASKT